MVNVNKKLRRNFSGIVEHSATIHIAVVNDRGDTLSFMKMQNMIMNTIKDDMSSLLANPSGTVDYQLRYIALGNGTTALAPSQTQLVTEQFRKALQSVSHDTVGIVTSYVYIKANEAYTFTTKEIGWFYGPTANNSPNTGRMIGRVLYDRAKTSHEGLQITRIDTYV